MRFVKTPYLPQNNVSVLIGGSMLNPYEKTLNELGIDIIFTSDNALFDSSLKSHADLYVNYYTEGKIVIDSSQFGIINHLQSEGLSVIYSNEPVIKEYPYDCRLNCLIIDDIIICNKAVTDSTLIKFADEKGLKIISVKQGYCKCSVLPVERNAFITDDTGIYSSLKSGGFDVLQVEKGSVALKGYNYGFIGGCGGKISKSQIVFCGNIKQHSNYQDIKCFLRNYNIEAVSLSDGELTDVGSIIPIIEK